MSKKEQLQNRLQELYRMKMLGFSYVDAKPVVSEPKTHLPQGFNDLKKAVSECFLCNLSKTRKNVVFGEGRADADLMIIGEGPGAMEDETGRPFVGKAGELLTKMIENAIDLKRGEVYIANVVKCRPPDNRAPEQEEVDACNPYLLKQIELIKPKVIMALGTTAYRRLTGDETPISRIRGKRFKFEDAELIPSFHPSYLLRNPSAKKEAFQDCLAVKSLLNLP